GPLSRLRSGVRAWVSGGMPFVEVRRSPSSLLGSSVARAGASSTRAGPPLGVVHHLVSARFARGLNARSTTDAPRDAIRTSSANAPAMVGPIATRLPTFRRPVGGAAGSGCAWSVDIDPQSIPGQET